MRRTYAEDRQIHNRQSARLQGRDYTANGMYFVTICTMERQCLLGDIIDGQMHLNEWGKIVDECWQKIPNHFPHVSTDAFVIMPNHVHGILEFHHSPRCRGVACNAPTGTGDMRRGAACCAPTCPSMTRAPICIGPQSGSLGAIVRSFKSAVTKRVNEISGMPGKCFWQRNYYDRIIRDNDELDNIRRYIMENPVRWSLSQKTTSQ